MKKILVFALLGILPNLWATQVLADNDLSTKIIDAAVKITDKFKFNAMSAEVHLLALTGRNELEGFQNWQSHTVYLACATVKAGLLVAGKAGICRGSDNQTYTLKGLGVGVVIGGAGSLLLGYVKTPDGEIRGDYDMTTMGMQFYSKSILWPFEILQHVKGINDFLGIDSLIGRNSETKNPLILIGPALGLMVDISGTNITVE